MYNVKSKVNIRGGLNFDPLIQTGAVGGFKSNSESHLPYKECEVQTTDTRSKNLTLEV